MVPKPSAPTVSVLKSLLTQIGSSTTGKKEILSSRLSQDLQLCRVPTLPRLKKRTRILSIDMGIKNLAFCVADVQLGTTTKQSAKLAEEVKYEMTIAAWRRLDVAEEVARSISQNSPTTQKSGTKAGLEGRSQKEVEGTDPYTPSALSHAAYTLLKHTLLPYKPDIILIERQRWRSAGGPTIQQWTVRVNTLEGMLWAVLTTLRAEARKQISKSKEGEEEFQVFEVDPKRVGNFWIGEDVRVKGLKNGKTIEDELALGPDGEVEEVARGGRDEVKKLSRRKAEKNAKIQRVRSWLGSSERSTVGTGKMDEPDSTCIRIKFIFCPEAEITREALCNTSPTKRRKIGEAPKMKKLDDVADCFLQAAAWVAWEGNRMKIAEKWASEKGRLSAQPTAKQNGEMDQQRKNSTRKGKGTAKSETAKTGKAEKATATKAQKQST